MTQLDDLQAYVNLEMPRRPVLLTQLNTGYDGDPNGGGAPSIIQNAPDGSLFLWETAERFYRKQIAGDWVQEDRSVIEDRSIYVDPTSGDDENIGSESAPVQTLFEASKRTTMFGLNYIYLEDGDHRAPDIATLMGTTDTRQRCLFYSGRGVEVIGRNFTTQQTVNITSWTNNVATVSDTLTPNAHVGQCLYLELWAGYYVAWWCFANTTNTLSFAISTSAFGGYFDPSTFTGSQNLVKPSARILPPSTNPTYFVNRPYYAGGIAFKNIAFDSDGTNARGLEALHRGSDLLINNCSFRGHKACLIHRGIGTILNTMFDGLGGSGTSGISHSGGYLSILSDTIFHDIEQGIGVINGATLATGSGNVLWSPGCNIAVATRNGRMLDFSSRFYTESGPYSSVNFMQLGHRDGYARQHAAFKQIGTTAMGFVFDTSSGGVNVDLLDSANAVVAGTPDYIRINGTGISLANYNAGNPPASAVRRYGVADKGIAFYD